MRNMQPEYRNFEDPIRSFDAYEAYMDQLEESRPQCDCCGGRIIEDSCTRINGLYFCDECISLHKYYFDN